MRDNYRFSLWTLVSKTLPPHSHSTVQCGVPAGELVLLVAPKRGQPARGAGGADGGLHWFGLHQPRAAAGHPGSVPAGAPGRSAAGACLGWSGMLAQADTLAQMLICPQEYSLKKKKHMLHKYVIWIVILSTSSAWHDSNDSDRSNRRRCGLGC